VAPGPEDVRLPRLAGAFERGHDAGADERRLADTRRARDGEERVIAQARLHPRDVARAAEEPIRVVLLECGEARIWTLVVLELAAVATRCERLELCEERLRVGDALGLLLCEAAIDDALEALGQIVNHRTDRRHRLVER
jgi:hypothetical protein